jgi:hypothetical protein
MQQRGFEPLIAVAVLGFCAISFMLGAAFTGSLMWKDLLEVVTAVGTIASAVVAAWLGVAATKRNQSQALDKASLVAARLLPLIAPPISELGLSAFLKVPDAGSKAAQAQKQLKLLGDLRDLLNGALQALDPLHGSDLEALSPLPNQAATRLARGISVARTTRDFIEALLQKPSWEERPFTTRLIEVHYALNGTREATDLCEVAVRACERLLNITATHPSNEELYGVLNTTY